ncbi:hypothetical protein ABZT51_23155 [Streptomyces sp. NPDC005373]|uniref:hypothetical protein n=1 Tax=Streptomyces sp. NPDC005373 TaxID=3156879 RepID=UPI0033B012C2
MFLVNPTSDGTPTLMTYAVMPWVGSRSERRGRTRSMVLADTLPSCSSTPSTTTSGKRPPAVKEQARLTGNRGSGQLTHVGHMSDDAQQPRPFRDDDAVIVTDAENETRASDPAIGAGK